MENGKGSFGGREVVIVEATRTPIGRGHPEKGYYKDVHPSTLLARNLEELVSRTGVDAGQVGDVIGGCVQQFGEQTFNITRNAWLQAGLPDWAPYVAFGASPRGPISMLHASRALALLRGRSYVLPQDVRELAPDALRHRLVMSYQALAEDVTADQIIEPVLDSILMPRLDLARQAVA